MHRIQLLIYRENAQQVAITPIKFDKQSYWSKARHCTFIYRVARPKKEFVTIHQMIIHQVAPFLNNVSFFESFCSLKVGCFTAIKNASRVFFFFFLQLFIGCDMRHFHWKTWLGCWKTCLAGSESLFEFSWSFQRLITFRFVSPM